MRAALVMSFVASAALAQPIDLTNGKFRNITVTGTENTRLENVGVVDAGTVKTGVLDAGVANVQGQLTVAGPVITAAAVTAGTFFRPGGMSAGGLSSGVLSGGGNGNGLILQGNAADNGTASAVRFINVNSLATDGAAVVDFFSDNASTKVAAIDKDGKLVWPTGGANAVAGRATLVAGTVTVSTTAVEAASIIQLTRCVTGGTVGHLSVGTVTADTSFVINSSSGTETSTICWQIAN